MSQPLFDPYALDNGKYARDRFYTASTDGRGNKESLTIKLAPYVYGQLGLLIEQQMIPAYRTRADFFRDAVVHRLHDLTEMMLGGKIVDELGELLRTEENGKKLLERIRAVEAVATGAIDAMKSALAIHDTGLLGEAIDHAEFALPTLPGGLRDKLNAELAIFRTELARMRNAY